MSCLSVTCWWMCAVMDESGECIFISPWTCDTLITCAHVCLCVCEWVYERGSAERNEGHPDDLDSCKLRRLIETYQYWWFFVCFFFACVCMKNTSTVWPTLFSGQTLVKLVTPPSPSTTCLPVNGHPSDCQGISQVVVQLTLNYPLCGLEVHFLSFGVS